MTDRVRVARWRLTVLLVAWVVTKIASAGWADASPPADLSDDERGKAVAESDDRTAHAVALYRQGKYRDALVPARAALVLALKALGPEHARVGLCENNLAELLKAAGEYPEACTHFERAIAIFEASLGKKHPNVAVCMRNLAGLRRFMGHPERARVLLECAIEIHRSALGTEHLEVALSMAALGLAVSDLGDYELAQRMFQRALAIQEKVYGPVHSEIGTSLCGLGQVLQAIGKYELARPCLERAVRIYEEIHGSDHPGVAVGLSHLAELLRVTGQTNEARVLLERELAIRRKAQGVAHPDVARALSNLGLVHKALGEYQDACNLLKMALTLAASSLGDSHPALAGFQGNLGALLVAMGRPEEAVAHLAKAVQVDERARGADHPDLAVSLNNLAVVEKMTGKLDAARKHYERALKILTQTLGSEHPRAAQVQQNLGRLLQLLDMPIEARDLQMLSLASAERRLYREFIALGPAERRALVRSVRGYLDQWLRLTPRIGQTGYEEVLRFKGIASRATAAERQLLIRGGDCARQQIAELRVAERRLAKVANAMPSALQSHALMKWQETYAAASVRRARLARALAKSTPASVKLRRRQRLTVTGLQAALNSTEVLVDVLRSDHRYLAWLVHSEGDVKRLDLGPVEDIEAAVTQYLELIADPRMNHQGADRVSSAARLQTLLVEPMVRHLRTQPSTIYFCPDAALCLLPMATLWREYQQTTGAANTRLVSLTLAQDWASTSSVRLQGRGILGLGGVNYATAAVSEKTQASEKSLTQTPGARAPGGRRYAPLPGTQKEVEGLRGQFGHECVLLLGGSATEAALRSHAGGKRCLHLATHGFVRTDLHQGLARQEGDQVWLGEGMERQLARGYDPMLLAGLALAGANSRDGANGDDGIMTAAEVSSLELDGAELVVLSACETALGTVESGDGVIGLVQAFQMAGAKDVIGSLWRVDDKATRLLMERFYELWSPKGKKPGLSATEALRQAQAHVRSTKGYEHPYYWAGWVLWTRR